MANIKLKKESIMEAEEDKYFVYKEANNKATFRFVYETKFMKAFCLILNPEQVVSEIEEKNYTGFGNLAEEILRKANKEETKEAMKIWAQAQDLLLEREI